MDFETLYERTEEPRIRYISFIGETKRFDLALIMSGQYYGKQIVLDLQGNRFAIIGEDDLEEPGYLESAFQLSEDEAAELRQFLYTTV